MEYGLSPKVIDNIKDIVNKYPKYKFVIFGSRAKGNFSGTSDIDIAIFENVSEVDKFHIMDDFDKLDIIYKIDIVFISNDTKKELLESINKNNIKL